MRILNTEKELLLHSYPDKNPITLKSRTDYILPDDVVDVIVKSPENGIIYRNDDFYSMADAYAYRGQDLTNKKLITFRNGGIGDLIFQLPSLKYLKKKYEGIHITLCCGRPYVNIFNNLPYIDKVISLPLELNELTNRDYYVNFEGLIEGGVINGLYYRNKDAEEKNAYDLHAEKFYVKPDDMCPELKLDDKYDRWFKHQIKPKIKNQKIVTISYTASALIRAVNPQTWVDFINDYPEDVNFFIVGTKSQLEAIQHMIEQTNKPNSCVNFCAIEDNFMSTNKVQLCDDIRYTIALIKNSDVMIGTDSGLLHIAGGLGTPMVGLFGAFPSELRLKYYKNAIGLDADSSCIFIDDDSKYKSCFQHGGGKCKLAETWHETYSPCMTIIHHQHIYNALIKLKIININQGEPVTNI